jgi:heat shock protein HslJ
MPGISVVLARSWVVGIAFVLGACTAHPTASTAAATPDSVTASTPPAGSEQSAGIEQSWTLVALEGRPVTVSSERMRPTLVFDAKAGRVSGLAAVNRFSGTYRIEGQSLKFGPLLSTKMAGAPEANELETRYLRALERTTGWRVQHGELELQADDQSLARFATGR